MKLSDFLDAINPRQMIEIYDKQDDICLLFSGTVETDGSYLRLKILGEFDVTDIKTEEDSIMVMINVEELESAVLRARFGIERFSL